MPFQGLLTYKVTIKNMKMKISFNSMYFSYFFITFKVKFGKSLIWNKCK